MIGREVVVEGYGPGDPPGGVALPELSGRELKDSARLFDLRRGLPGGDEVGEESHGWGRTREGEEEVQQDPHPPASFEVDQAGLPRDLDPGAGDGLLQGLNPSATTRVRLYLLHSLTGRSQ